MLDDFSRYIVAWKLCTTMRAGDVIDTLELALEAPGLRTANVVRRPRLLSDNGSSYISRDLVTWLPDRRVRHGRGVSPHPMTQGEIERWRQTLKKPEPAREPFPAGDLESQIHAFVGHYDHRRYHESLGKLTPAETTSDGTGALCRNERESSARQSSTGACSIAAPPPNKSNRMRQSLPPSRDAICPKIPDDGKRSVVRLDRNDARTAELPDTETARADINAPASHKKLRAVTSGRKA